MVTFRPVSLPFMAATVDQSCRPGLPGYLTRNRESSEWPDRSTTQMPTACS
jgi:hypothetical protein